jgi:hypothetical protein
MGNDELETLGMAGARHIHVTIDRAHVLTKLS